MTIDPLFLGKGPSFPFRKTVNELSVSFSEGEALVKESMKSILFTGVGERPFRVKRGTIYGTRVKNLLFSSDDALLDVINYDIKAALDVWEPRIIVISVTSERVLPTANSLPGVRINVLFKYRSSNREDNLVITSTEDNIEAT